MPLNSTQGPRNTEKTVEVMNDTVKNVVFLTNLTADTTYDLSVSAFVASQGGLSSILVSKKFRNFSREILMSLQGARNDSNLLVQAAEMR